MSFMEYLHHPCKVLRGIIMIRNELNHLKDKDLYSLVLFALYKMIPIPEYSSLSQLIYVLDKTNFLNLCEYFGGQTIKIPTIEEIESLMCALRIFEKEKLQHIPYEKAIEEFQGSGRDLKRIKEQYKQLTKVIDIYDFKTGSIK